MSKLVAIVKSIRTHQNLNIVEFDFMNTVLKMMSLDLNSNVQVGKKVELLFKPSSEIFSCVVITKTSPSFGTSFTENQKISPFQ